MNQDTVVSLATQAMTLGFEVAGPILLVGLVIGLAVSLFQAVTQIQEQSLSFIPKILGLAGLIVDSASEVLKIPADAVEAPPAVFQEGGLNCVTGLAKVAGRLVVLLDMSKLLAPGSLQIPSEPGEKKTAAKAEARGAGAR